MAENLAGMSANETSKNAGLVEVEPKNVLPTPDRYGNVLLPYRYRRESWGVSFGLGASNYSPQNYSPDFLLADYPTVYGLANLPLLEFRTLIKRNFTLGSIGVEAAVGQFHVNSRSSVTIANTDVEPNSELSLTIGRIGATFVFDNLFREPIAAPYVSGGGYSVYFGEKKDGGSFNGVTQIAPYFAAGLLVQVNKLDPDSAVEAYESFGLENTFAYLEVRQFVKSQASKDPDFSSPLAINAGLTLEF